MIWVFADHTDLIIGLVVRWLIFLGISLTQIYVSYDIAINQYGEIEETELVRT